MLRYGRLYWYFLKNRFKILLEYRMNFIIGAGSTVVLQAAGLATIWAVMRQIPDLQGWSFDEILLIYGFLTLSKSINHMFADNLWVIGREYIRTGAFDRFLVRPINPLFHLLADRFCHDGIGNFVVGIALVAKASLALNIPWSPGNLAFAALMVASGGVIFIALNLLTAVTSFWIIDSIPVTQMVFNSHEFARYPLTIYQRGIGILMTWLIPYGFAAYYPAAALLGRSAGAVAWAGPLVAAVALIIAYRAWLYGLRHYGSTGS